MNNTLELILLILLIIFAALTAAAEISLIAISRLRLRRLASDGSKTAKAILKILETPEKFFGTILVANNIVDALIASLVTAIAISVIGVGPKAVVIATAITAFVIIVSEVAAKTLAAKHSERVSWALARPVRFLIILLSPVVRVLAVIINFIVKVVGGQTSKRSSLFNEEDMRALMKIGAEEGVLHKEKYKMLSRVFDFSETLISSVMTPKKDIVSISVDSRLEEIMETVLESGYSRIPVYKGDKDSIIGIVNMKDVLRLATNQDLIVLQDIIYQPVYVSGTKKVSELLREFQKGHTHLAVVTDSQNKIQGVVSLEDLLEEIVGEIEDEYDIRASLPGKSL